MAQKNNGLEGILKYVIEALTLIFVELREFPIRKSIALAIIFLSLSIVIYVIRWW